MFDEYVETVVNHANFTNVRAFSIFNLFGRYNVSLNFDKEVNIYVGENGLGKTTILSCLYAVLNKKFSLLENVDFSKIEIGFRKNSKPYVVTKGDFIEYNRRNGKLHRSLYENEEYIDYLFSHISFDELKNLSNEEMQMIVREAAHEQGVPPQVMRRYFYELRDDGNYKSRTKGDRKKVIELTRLIDENIKEKIIYLPTYRRIENDSTTFNIRNDSMNNAEMLIKFGMGDVQKSIDSILKRIRDLAVENYNEMSGILLKQYVEGNEWAVEMDNSIDTEAVKIVLNRLGNQISKETNLKILNIVESGKIYEREYLYLQNLLSKLISNYDAQRRYDDRINGFVDTCNRYLVDKELRYDPSGLKLNVYLKTTKNSAKTIELTQLSSGEKQIVSLFSKMYLESDGKNIIIIDEPELSLSLKWQQMLLPDVMRSGNCGLLITVTHSPFIFENEFDMDAKEIRACMANN